MKKQVRDRFPLPHNTIDTATRNERVLPIGVQCQSAGWGANVSTDFAIIHLSSLIRFLNITEYIILILKGQ